MGGAVLSAAQQALVVIAATVLGFGCYFGFIVRMSARARLGLCTRDMVYNFVQQSVHATVLRVLDSAFSIVSCVIFLVGLDRGSWAQERDGKDSVELALEDAEAALYVFFTYNFLMQLYSAPDRYEFLASSQAVIDIVTVVPSWVATIVFFFASVNSPDLLSVAGFCGLVRVLRLFGVAQNCARAFKDPITHQMAAVVGNFLAAVFVTASGVSFLSIAAGEGFGDELDFVDALYFSVSTLSTVGYGDISPVSTAARCVVVVLIVVLIIYIPMQTSSLANLLSLRSAYDGAYNNTIGDHVVLFAEKPCAAIQVFVSEFLHPDHGILLPRILLVMPQEPDTSIKSLILRHALSGQLQFLRGDLLHSGDIHRCRVSEAVACFMLVDRMSRTPNEDDAVSLIRVLALRAYAEHVPLYTQVVDRGSRHNFFEVGIAHFRVACVRTLHMQMLAQSSIWRGFAPLIHNLLRSVDVPSDIQHGMLDDDYVYGLNHELYSVSLHGFQGVSFKTAVKMLHHDYGVYLLGVSSPRHGVLMYPGNSYTCREGDSGFILGSSSTVIRELCYQLQLGVLDHTQLSSGGAAPAAARTSLVGMPDPVFTGGGRKGSKTSVASADSADASPSPGGSSGMGRRISSKKARKSLRESGSVMPIDGGATGSVTAKAHQQQRMRESLNAQMRQQSMEGSTPPMSMVKDNNLGFFQRSADEGDEDKAEPDHTRTQDTVAVLAPRNAEAKDGGDNRRGTSESKVEETTGTSGLPSTTLSASSASSEQPTPPTNIQPFASGSNTSSAARPASSEPSGHEPARPNQPGGINVAHVATENGGATQGTEQRKASVETPSTTGSTSANWLASAIQAGVSVVTEAAAAVAGTTGPTAERRAYRTPSREMQASFHVHRHTDALDHMQAARDALSGAVSLVDTVKKHKETLQRRNLRHHVVLCTQTLRDTYVALRTLRSGFNPALPVVILCPLLETMHAADEEGLKQLTQAACDHWYICQGHPSSRLDLRKAQLRTASRLILLPDTGGSVSQSRADTNDFRMHSSTVDALTIQNVVAICKHKGRATVVTTELNNMTLCAHVGRIVEQQQLQRLVRKGIRTPQTPTPKPSPHSSADNEADPIQDDRILERERRRLVFELDPTFARGDIVPGHLTDLVLCQAFYNPAVIPFVSVLTNGYPSYPPGHAGPRGANLCQIPVPSKFVQKRGRRKGGMTFGSLFTYLLHNYDVLSFALVVNTGNAASQTPSATTHAAADKAQCVITAPHASREVALSDHVFVFVNNETTWEILRCGESDADDTNRSYIGTPLTSALSQQEDDDDEEEDMFDEEIAADIDIEREQLAASETSALLQSVVDSLSTLNNRLDGIEHRMNALSSAKSTATPTTAASSSMPTTSTTEVT